jgi:hypothetical protein
MDSPGLVDKGLSRNTTHKMKRTTPHYRLSVAGMTADELHCTTKVVLAPSDGLPYRFAPSTLSGFGLVNPIVLLQGPTETTHANPKGNEFHRRAKYSQLRCENIVQEGRWLWLPLSNI